MMWWLRYHVVHNGLCSLIYIGAPRKALDATTIKMLIVNENMQVSSKTALKNSIKI